MASLASSCAYYNTFYLARRYYDRANQGLPYPVEKPNPAEVQNLNKSIEYSKKLLANYSKSKWTDDAYLLWARSLLGKEDPLQTVNMLRDFSQRYPNSQLHDEAVFYLGVGYRQARKPSDAVSAFEDFLTRAPKHELAPYAHLERARSFIALKRYEEAGRAASEVIDRFPKSQLRDRATLTRAEARMAQEDFEKAGADYRAMWVRARTDEERFDFLLKQGDALEGARRYDEALSLLRDALSHERAPAIVDTARIGTLPPPTQGAGGDRWARLQIRIGTVYMLQGDQARALGAYRRVIESFPHTQFGAEAQYRIAYVYETVSDDFESARTEYGRVRIHSSSSVYATQASQRLANLERLAQFREAGGDSLARKAEAGFLLAEQYLFQLDKPDRAITEYRRIALQYPGTAMAAKAMNAEAWVMRTRYKRPGEADSILWRVVREYPATEAQLAARDYLEAQGHLVAANLIRLPEPPPPVFDTAAVALTPPPAGSIPLGSLRTQSDTAFVGPRLDRMPPALRDPGGPPAAVRRSPLDDPPQPGRDEIAPGGMTSRTPPRPQGSSAPADTTARTVRTAPADTTRRPAPPDTTKRQP